MSIFNFDLFYPTYTCQNCMCMSVLQACTGGQLKCKGGRKGGVVVVVMLVLVKGGYGGVDGRVGSSGVMMMAPMVVVRNY